MVASSLPRGALCISIDFEILWGVWDHVRASDVALSSRYEGAVIERLAALFERHDVPATWAIVARLIDDRHGFDGLLGPRGNWFAPKLVDRVVRSRVAHEIGSHSYGHVYFGSVSPAEAEEDLRRAKEVHDKNGWPFDSFVFPRNQVGHLDRLQTMGIKVFRSVDAGILRASEKISPRLRPLVNVAEKALGLPSALVLPRHLSNGLCELPSSTLLLGRDGLRKAILPSVMTSKLVRAVDRAAVERKVFHLWFHPSNFYFDGPRQFDVLERVLAVAAKRRDAGSLDIRTMRTFGATT